MKINHVLRHWFGFALCVVEGQEKPVWVSYIRRPALDPRGK